MKRRKDSNDSGGSRKNRRANVILPTRFLLGGNIKDPLNLASFKDAPLQDTPKSSPIPTPKHKKEIEVLIPANIRDPLNLTGSPNSSFVSTKPKKKRKNKKRKRTDSENTNACDSSIQSVQDTSENQQSQEPLQCLPSDRGKIPIDQEIHTTTNQKEAERPEVECHEADISIHANAKISDGKNSRGRRKRTREIFRYGNYNSYYSYRNENAIDARVSMISSEWIRDKDVLDVGCNCGVFTAAIASKFAPKTILGIDIDSHLISLANKNIQKFMTKNNLPSESSTMESSTLDCGKIEFKCENYVFDSDERLKDVVPEFDTILCLSTTKWIHLNFGDDGLKRVFKRFYRHLRPGGRLILEPQPFETYAKNRKHKLLPEMHQNYKDIRLKPDAFESYLLSSDIGFDSCIFVNTTEHECQGFRRPVFVFVKSAARSDLPISPS